MDIPLKITITRKGEIECMRRVTLYKPSLQVLSDRVKEWVKGNFELKYLDDEGDMILMESNIEWNECIRIWKATASGPLRLEVKKVKSREEHVLNTNVPEIPETLESQPTQQSDQIMEQSSIELDDVLPQRPQQFKGLSEVINSILIAGMKQPGEAADLTAGQDQKPAKEEKQKLREAKWKEKKIAREAIRASRKIEREKKQAIRKGEMESNRKRREPRRQLKEDAKKATADVILAEQDAEETMRLTREAEAEEYARTVGHIKHLAIEAASKGATMMAAAEDRRMRDKYSHQIIVIERMGLQVNNEVIELLQKHDGSVVKVVADIFA